MLNKIDVLRRVNLATLNQALDANDLSLIRMQDGLEPTQDELNLILDAGPEDYLAALAELERLAVVAQNKAWAAKRSHALFVKYKQSDDDTVGDVMPRMSPEDAAEFKSLVHVGMGE